MSSCVKSIDSGTKTFRNVSSQVSETATESEGPNTVLWKAISLSSSGIGFVKIESAKDNKVESICSTLTDAFAAHISLFISALWIGISTLFWDLDFLTIPALFR